MGQKHEVIFLTDEEFAEYKRQEKRKSFLSELENMSKPKSGSRATSGSSFSVKNIKSSKKETTEPEDSEPHIAQMAPPTATADDWSEFMENFDNAEGLSSPLESITDQRITGYQLDTELESTGSRYERMFKPELAMLSEVLKEVKTHGARVNKELQKMTPTGKGAGNRSAGVSKGYSDLVEAYNSINTSKVQIIKAMADLRSKQVEWEMKERAANPENQQNTETMADQFYQRIINGGTKNFIQNSMQQYAHEDFQYDAIDDEDAFGAPVGQGKLEDPSTVDSLVASVGFNITQPIKGSRNIEDGYVDGDEFGNIRNENGGIEICVFEYGEGNYQFAALDQDGEVVEGIEVPSDIDPSIVATLKMKPGSDYVYDKFNRRYRVIQMGTVDASDVDDMDYPFD